MTRKTVGDIAALVWGVLGYLSLRLGRHLWKGTH